MKDELPLSVAVITLNEEDNIERCLNSVSWARERLVVDSGSDDRTVEIAESMGARVLRHEWEGHVKQKQFATDRAEFDWVLSLDADEEVSEELSRAIRKRFRDGTPSPDTCFEVNRLCYFLGRWIRHGGWYPDWIVRLFNRTSTRWGGEDPHDYVVPTGHVERLSGPLYHYPYENIADNVDYGNYYSSIQARQKARNGESGNILRAIGHGGFKFVRDYVLRRGFLDGVPGIIITTIASFDVFCKYAKLWEIRNTDPDENVSYPKK